MPKSLIRPRHTFIILIVILLGHPNLSKTVPSTAHYPLAAEFANRCFMATTIAGGESILASEIGSLVDAHSITESKAQVFFQGTSRTGFEAIMKLRTSLKVLEKIIDGHEIESKDDLYSFVSSFEWDSIISSESTIKCDATVGQVSKELSHTHFSALTVKNAIVDYFRDKYNKRPSVDLEEPDLPLLLYAHRGRTILYRIWSGDSSMHKRGYRRDSSIHRAALRETTAALLVLSSGWKPEDGILCDPMCGSGTIAIEAALIAATCFPGIIRYEASSPTCLKWKDLEGPKETWRSVVGAAKAADRREVRGGRSTPIVFGNDIHPGAVELAVQASR